MRSSKDWQEFDDFYAKAMAGGTLFEQTASAPAQTRESATGSCREPIRYTGQEALQREIELLKSSLGAHAVGDAFLTSTAPASVEVGRKNEYYKSDEEFVYALADALKVEYEAIAQAGPATCRSTTPGCRRSGTASASRWASRLISVTAWCASRR